MNFIDFFKNLTIINWISISIPVLIIATGISLRLYYRKKLRDLDGVMGIIKSEKEEELDEKEKATKMK